MSETPSAENGLRLCPKCGHVPREGFGCAGRPTPSDIWAGVYPGDCDCGCPVPPGATAEPDHCAACPMSGCRCEINVRNEGDA